VKHTTLSTIYAREQFVAGIALVGQFDDDQSPGNAVIALTTSVIVPKRCGDDKHKHNIDQKSGCYNRSDGRHENRLLSFTSTVEAIS
jgi:hypothetical protein